MKKIILILTVFFTIGILYAGGKGYTGTASVSVKNTKTGETRVLNTNYTVCSSWQKKADVKNILSRYLHGDKGRDEVYTSSIDYDIEPCE